MKNKIPMDCLDESQTSLQHQIKKRKIIVKSKRFRVMVGLCIMFTLIVITSSIIGTKIKFKKPTSDKYNLKINQTWKQYGTTKAGGNGYGTELNQLYDPWGFYVDDDETIYVADTENHRIVEWKSNATDGLIVAGGNGKGNRNDRLYEPTNVIVDKQNDYLIICDSGNSRVVRWPRRNGTSGEILISNIECGDLIMDNDGYLYICDLAQKHVIRWKTGTNFAIVAGGNRAGNRRDEPHGDCHIFIDEDHSVYVSDFHNHRVMKWEKGAKEGIVVVGGQSQGNSFRQLYYPMGISVDKFGNVYVADLVNDRVMGWVKGAEEGTVIVGGNGKGNQSNQFYRPIDLSFDRQNNLYVLDRLNHRVQKFDAEI